MIVNTISSKKFILISIIILSLTSTLVMTSANSCGIKRGFLYVSEDGTNFVEVTEDFDVHPGRKYWLKIVFVVKPLDLGDSMLVRVVKETECTEENGWMEVDIDHKSTEPFEWKVPQDARFSTLYVVQFMKPIIDYIPTIVYVAMGKICHVGRIHIIPEFAFGTISAVVSAISGLFLYKKYKI